MHVWLPAYQRILTPTHSHTHTHTVSTRPIGPYLRPTLRNCRIVTPLKQDRPTDLSEQTPNSFNYSQLKRRRQVASDELRRQYVQ